jgi:hypothetical protein
MAYVNERVEWQENLRAASPQWMQWFYAIGSFGQWRNRKVMRAWYLLVCFLGFIFCLALLIATIFFGR